MSTIDALLDEAGQTFADEAGIALEDKPAPLYRGTGPAGTTAPPA